MRIVDANCCRTRPNRCATVSGARHSLVLEGVWLRLVQDRDMHIPECGSEACDMGKIDGRTFGIEASLDSSILDSHALGVGDPRHVDDAVEVGLIVELLTESPSRCLRFRTDGVR